MKRLTFYLKIWWTMNIKNILPVFGHNKTILIFLTGKVIRFSLFFGFLYLLVKKTGSLAGYTLNQTIFFFLTFSLMDTISQFLFREVYMFRSKIISGDFDHILLKPINPLFRILLGGADIIDLITIPPLIILTWVYGKTLLPQIYETIYFLILVLNGLLVSTALHIVVLALGVITLEVDNTIMIFRDLTSMGRFPIEIYKEPIKSLLTYLIPVGVMIAIPAKSLMGFVTLPGVVSSLVFGIALIFLSIKFWNYSLRKYTSASS